MTPIKQPVFMESKAGFFSWLIWYDYFLLYFFSEPSLASRKITFKYTPKN